VIEDDAHDRLRRIDSSSAPHRTLPITIRVASSAVLICVSLSVQWTSYGVRLELEPEMHIQPACEVRELAGVPSGGVRSHVGVECGTARTHEAMT
jgi:hypothetical protein